MGRVAKVGLNNLKTIVESDKGLAAEVVRTSWGAIRDFTKYQFGPDITGKPELQGTYLQFKKDQFRGLEKLANDAFYARVDAVITDSQGSERKKLLVTRAREMGNVEDGDWLIVSWTSPIANRLLGKRPGETVEIRVRRSVVYEVGESASYETLVPQVANARFHLRSGDAAVASETDFLSLGIEQKAPAQLPARSYAAKPLFGLGDIIALVDEPQRAAMALPFGQSVVIDGPPGSGKTSVGLMRIAVLYDQQWAELELERGKDKPFHDYSSMRVLVYNEEMVGYLRSLAQSIGADRVQVQTTTDFFRKACREAKMLTGTTRRDKPSLARIKGRREVLRPYFAGFQRSVQEFFRENEEAIRSQLRAIGPDFLALADYLRAWSQRVQDARIEGDQIVGSIGLTDGLTDLAKRIGDGVSPTRGASQSGTRDPRPLGEDRLESGLREARQIVSAAVHAACDRSSIVRCMFETDEYRQFQDLLLEAGESRRVMVDGDRLWRTQYEGDLPAYSENDLAVSAWLAAPIFLTGREAGKPWIGGRLDRLTHVVLDEAQDVSPSHVAILKGQLAQNGTMTLVGDIHQNLNPHAGLRSWDEIAMQDVRASSFAVNHRQTRQLGEFLRGVHSGLFGEQCHWTASPSTVGALPRAGIARSWKALAAAIVAETLHWREIIDGAAGATVAVLYDGTMKPDNLRKLYRRLELELGKELIEVEVADPRSGGETLRKTDRVIIASVRQTKGLEFDAVIFVEPSARWSKPVEEIDLRIRNGFYVATSRARAGLSICMSNLPSCLDGLHQAGLLELVSWSPVGDDTEEAAEPSEIE